MKILVLSNIEWADTNAFGNTVSNWFYGMEGVKFFSLYRRTSMPYNRVCEDYYRITLKDVIINCFRKERIGERFNYQFVGQEPDNNKNDKPTLEKRVISFLHKYKFFSLSGIEDLFFPSRKWDNKKFRTYIKDVDPDIIFTFITASKSSLRILTKIKEICPNCKIVGHIADDVYGVAKKKHKKLIRKQIGLANLLYGASQKLCNVYEQSFGKTIKPLYKGCRFAEPKEKLNDTVKMIYAGNLLYGRGNTLAQLVRALAKHNDISDRKIELDIYTGTEIKASLAKWLNLEGVSRLNGAISYSEVKEKMADADINLHVESFEKKSKEEVIYSFSTKIIDCLQSGSVMLAIGPSDIASIEYVSSIDGTFVVSNLDELDKLPNKILSADLSEMAEKTSAFAHANHDIVTVQENLKKDFENLLQG